jgi:hypothetical protein
MRTNIWNYAKIVLSNVLLLGALLLVSEVLYRTYHFFPAEMLSTRTFPGEGAGRVARQWARQDPELGWVFSGNYRAFVNPSYYGSWTASVNRDGFRAASNFDDIGPKGPIKRLMVLGDSFTFGVYVNDSETLTSLLQEKLGNGYEVYNFGIPGWGIDQMYLAYQKYVGRIDPDFVLVVYIDDDIPRVFESFRKGEGNKPSFKVVGGRLKSRDGDKPGALEWMAKKSLLVDTFYNRLFKHSECQNIAETVFAELSREARQRDQQLIVVRYPYKDEIQMGKKNLEYNMEQYFKSNGIKYLDPGEDMRVAFLSMHTGGEAAVDFHLSQDEHPAKGGNDFVAGYILKKSNIQGILTRPH